MLTKLPEPILRVIRPSFFSLFNALVTVGRDTPYLLASSYSVGILSPSVKLPSLMDCFRSL